MTKTATRTAQTQAPSGTTTEIETGKAGAKVLDALSGLRLARILAERAEAPVKEQAKALWADAAEELEVGDVLVVKAKGVVRGKVTLKKRAPQVDLDLLEQAFPEAFQACVNLEFHTPQFDPA